VGSTPTARTTAPRSPPSAKARIDIRTLQQWMGHRDIASTMVYLKGVRNRDIRARLNKGSLAAFA
jgi:integrase